MGACSGAMGAGGRFSIALSIRWRMASCCCFMRCSMSMRRSARALSISCCSLLDAPGIP